MKSIVYLSLFLSLVFLQCKEKNQVVPPVGTIKEIDIIDFSVPKIDPKNITVGEDFIVINLPENNAEGDYIKPHVILENGYSTQSSLLNGFSFEGKNLELVLEGVLSGSKKYQIIVVPYDAVKLTEPAKNYKITIEPNAAITVPISLKGTITSVNDSGQIVREPSVILTNKATGQISTHFTDISEKNGSKELKLKFPATVAPGEYSADVVWGTKRELLSNQLSVVAGSLQLKKVSWNMLPDSKYFTISGFNISKDAKYELIIENDFIEKQKVVLSYKDAGTLEGNVPKDVPTGNYKFTYFENGKKIEALEYENAVEKAMGSDNVYIRTSTTQPVLKVISQPSKKATFTNTFGSLDYYEPTAKISRSEVILAYVKYDGAYPERNELILRNRSTGKIYTLIHNSDNSSYLFDGYMFFRGFNITRDIPNGLYEAHVIIGDLEPSEKYSQIISIE